MFSFWKQEINDLFGTTLSNKTDCVNEFPHKHHVVYVCFASVPNTGCINRFHCYCINHNIRSFVEFCLEHYSGLKFFERFWEILSSWSNSSWFDPWLLVTQSWWCGIIRGLLQLRSVQNWWTLTLIKLTWNSILVLEFLILIQFFKGAFSR